MRDEVAQDNQEEIIAEVREEIMNKVTKASNFVDISRNEALNLENGLNNNLVVIDLVANTLDGTSRQATQQEVNLISANPSPPELSGFEVRYKLPIKKSLVQKL